MPVTAEELTEAVTAVAGEGGSDDFRQPEDETGEAGTAGAAGSMLGGDPGAQPSITQVMQMLAQLINNMPASMAAAIKADKPQSHFDNAKLDIRNFSRIDKFTNKRSDWREWRSQFVYAVAECDNAFATTLTSMERRDNPIDMKSDLTVTQSQLSSVLFNRLQSVTTLTANTMVLSADGNGVEAWRLLNGFFDHKQTRV